MILLHIAAMNLMAGRRYSLRTDTSPAVSQHRDAMSSVGYQALYEHVCGWLSKGVPLDVIQSQMGHASIQTTTSIYGRVPIQRRADELGKAFGQ